jgi:hypothetical protein
MLEGRTLLSLTVIPYDPNGTVADKSKLIASSLAQNSGLNILNGTYVGVSGQGGTYSGFDLSDGTNHVSIPDGLILTNGVATGVEGPNPNRAPGVTYGSASISNNLGQPGDTDLTTLTGGPTFDANSLTLTFTTAPGVKSISFQLLFASEEFPQFVGSFNDAFGAYLDGQQITTDSSGKPLTVNNNFFTFNNSGQTPDQYAATAGKTPVNFNFGYDGLTMALTTTAPLNPNVTVHTLKFAIADALDGNLDSAIFLTDVTGSTQASTGPTTNPSQPTGFVVSNTNDSGPGSLRSVIQAADASTTPATITFNLPGSGPFVIAPLTPLPALTSTVTINGYSQPGAQANTAATGDNAVVLIQLWGVQAGSGTDGLTVSAPSCVIEGLTIDGFSGNGITLNGNALGTTIEGDFIGIDPKGATAMPNGGFGVAVVNTTPSSSLTGSVAAAGKVSSLAQVAAKGATIGGTLASARNVISGNGMAGVELATGVSGVVVEGNYVGTDATGSKAVGNRSAGILLSDSASDTIGGTVAGAGNVISGNGSTATPGAGLWIEGPGATGNLTVGNTIGASANGQNPLGNISVGLLINDASNNTIGARVAQGRNVISGNGIIGLMIAGTSQNNLAINNAIGSDVTGTKALGNGGVVNGTLAGTGVYINAAPNNTIGGSTLPGVANVISGNTFDGVELLGPTASGNVVSGNLIGVAQSGTVALANGDDGIVIDSADKNQIMSNIIGSNLRDGLTISGAQAVGNVVVANAIGLGLSNTPLGNGAFGVLLVNQAPAPVGLTSVNTFGPNALGNVRDTSLAPSSDSVNLPAVPQKSTSVHSTKNHVSTKVKTPKPSHVAKHRGR